MKRKWDNHQLVEHWIIDEKDQQFIDKKRGINRLCFALLLKYKMPCVIRVFDEGDYGQSDWEGQS